MSRVILHMDMDAFYASVEVHDDPSLAGKPLIIGALPSERGVVSTCSYEARPYGVRSGMSIKEAYRLCPNGIYMHGHFHRYHEVSDQVHADPPKIPRQLVGALPSGLASRQMYQSPLSPSLSASDSRNHSF